MSQGEIHMAISVERCVRAQLLHELPVLCNLGFVGVGALPLLSLAVGGFGRYRTILGHAWMTECNRIQQLNKNSKVTTLEGRRSYNFRTGNLKLGTPLSGNIGSDHYSLLSDMPLDTPEPLKSSQHYLLKDREAAFAKEVQSRIHQLPARTSSRAELYLLPHTISVRR
ncbi:hypothetical protein IWW34DRAFT_796799 [Fusarium oxysporum f. sp. albedinis]|nr:hypothetical protein IWW34DRAFT_796799 [Fusarium oxysporum f. sp. albedinis]